MVYLTVLYKIHSRQKKLMDDAYHAIWRQQISVSCKFCMLSISFVFFVLCNVWYNQIVKKDRWYAWKLIVTNISSKGFSIGEKYLKTMHENPIS
jgi:hypothetical protein